MQNPVKACRSGRFRVENKDLKAVIKLTSNIDEETSPVYINASLLECDICTPNLSPMNIKKTFAKSNKTANRKINKV